MNKIKYTFQIEVETDNLPEKELAEMIATALAEGAEANTDESTSVNSITYEYTSELKGAGSFTFGRNKEPEEEYQAGLGL